jgi:hypothetical protein
VMSSRSFSWSSKWLVSSIFFSIQSVSQCIPYKRQREITPFLMRNLCHQFFIYGLKNSISSPLKFKKFTLKYSLTRCLRGLGNCELA